MRQRGGGRGSQICLFVINVNPLYIPYLQWDGCGALVLQIEPSGATSNGVD